MHFSYSENSSEYHNKNMEPIKLSGKKATYTALCIIPPNSLWPEFQLF